VLLVGGLAVLLVDEHAQQVGDLLLAGRGSVELATDLDEPVVHLRPEVGNFRPEVGNYRPGVGEVLAHRVEAGGRGLAEVPDLRADLGHVTISPAGQRAGGCRILLAAANAPGQLLALGLQSSYPRLRTVERQQDGEASTDV